MAVHTMSKFVENAWTDLATIGSYTADLGVLGRGLDAERAEQILITNGEGAAAEVFIVGVGSNKGVIKIATGNVADNDCIMIGDGVHVPDIYESDTGTAATGVLQLAVNPNDGDQTVISDGTTAVNFEFDIGVKASGILSVDDNPHAGDILVISDGVHALNFEADGVGANVNFAVGVDAPTTLGNLKTAMNAVGAGFTVTAGAQAGGGPWTLALQNDDYGTIGNVTLDLTGATSGHWAASTGMAGGLNAGSGPITGDVAVAIAATNLLSLANLKAKINLHAFNLTAGTITGDAVALANDNVGIAGNVAITENTAGARIVVVSGMSGGVNPGSAIVAGHLGFAKGANASASATNLAAKINASAVGNYTAGTPYADPDVPTTYCIPITGDSSYDRLLMDTFGANITVVEDTTEYQQNGIQLNEVTGSAETGWTPVASGGVPVPPAQKVTMTSIAGAGTGIFQITKGLNGLSVPGWIQADIIVLPHLLVAGTTIGAFTAATDKVVATGVVRNH